MTSEEREARLAEMSRNKKDVHHDRRARLEQLEEKTDKKIVPRGKFLSDFGKQANEERSLADRLIRRRHFNQK